MRLAARDRSRRVSIGQFIPGIVTTRYILAGVLCFGGLPAAPQQPASAPASAPKSDKSKDPLNRESPQSTVVAFLEAYHSHDYLRAARYLDLRKLPRTERLNKGSDLAQQLGKILDRDAQFDVADLTRDPEGSHASSLAPDRERVDSITVNNRTEDLELQRVRLRSGLLVWVFSSDSVDRIPQIARLTSDSTIERHLPAQLVDWSILNMSLWRWIALALLIAVVAGAAKLLSPLVIGFGEPLIKRIAPRVKWDALRILLPPIELVLAVALIRAGLAWIEPSTRVRPYLDKCLTLFFFLGLAWLSMRIVDLTIQRLAVILRSRHQSFSYSVLPLSARVLKIAILLLMIAAVLSDWGYNTTTIVAGLGVGGIAIALAAQKTIENFFGGVAVVSDRPVTVGDFCKFGDRMGTVEDIGLRSTRIRTLERTLVTVPNGQFSSMTLENFDQRDKMLFHFTLNLRRDTKPDQVRALLESITDTLVHHPKVETGPLPVRFVGVGTYSLDIEIFAHVLTRNGDEFMKIQQDLYLWILDAVENAGTALALPTQASIAYSNETDPQSKSLNAWEPAGGRR